MDAASGLGAASLISALQFSTIERVLTVEDDTRVANWDRSSFTRTVCHSGEVSD